MSKFKFLLPIIFFISGCSTVKEAHTEFRKEIDGFKAEWARVILKQEPKEY